MGSDDTLLRENRGILARLGIGITFCNDLLRSIELSPSAIRPSADDEQQRQTPCCRKTSPIYRNVVCCLWLHWDFIAKYLLTVNPHRQARLTRAVVGETLNGMDGHLLEIGGRQALALRRRRSPPLPSNPMPPIPSRTRVEGLGVKPGNRSCQITPGLALYLLAVTPPPETKRRAPVLRNLLSSLACP